MRLVILNAQEITDHEKIKLFFLSIRNFFKQDCNAKRQSKALRIFKRYPNSITKSGVK